MNALAVSNDEFSAVGYEPEAPYAAALEEQNKKHTGRPSTYTAEIAKLICDQLAQGVPLTKICAADGMPWAGTVYEWRARQPAFSEAYARAREDAADALADEIVNVADDQTLDPNARRVMVDARKWVAAKLKPKSYGDKLDLTVTSQATLPTLDLSALSAEEIQVFERLLAKAQAPVITAQPIDITPIDVTALTSRDTQA